MSSPAIQSEKTAITSLIPGLHIVANFATKDSTHLIRFESFRDFIFEAIQDNNLCRVGEVFHNFDNGGYTAVVCLTESHLSIHTWPEKQYLTFDIFLSNYLKDNRAVTRKLYASVRDFFQASVLFEQLIER